MPTSPSWTSSPPSRTKREPPRRRSPWFIVPIPGSRKLNRIEENLGAADVDLSDDEFTRIENELAKIEIHGNRTDEDIAKLYQRD